MLLDGWTWPIQPKNGAQTATVASRRTKLLLFKTAFGCVFSPEMNDTVIMPRPTGHPLAGRQMTGAQMLVQVLADEGVTAIFGYSGGAILPTYDAVFLFNEQAQAQGGRQGPLVGSGCAWSPPAPARPTPSRRCATAWPTPSRWSSSAARSRRPPSVPTPSR